LRPFSGGRRRAPSPLPPSWLSDSLVTRILGRGTLALAPLDRLLRLGLARIGPSDRPSRWLPSCAAPAAGLSEFVACPARRRGLRFCLWSVPALTWHPGRGVFY
ncbi:unnamed protein product, partial [Amoebophrya sp. A120]